MKDFNLVINMQYRTALLESLEWDESKLVQLMEYLNTEFNSFDLKHPFEIIEFVKDNFSKETSEELKRIFMEQVIFNNMHKGDYNEEN